MTRDPLMLSDTAMVLLRRYIELCDDYWDFYIVLKQSYVFADHDSHWKAWEDTHRNRNRSREILWQLMHEIWLLWTFRDVPIVRQMDWHFVFNAPLMNLAENTFIPLCEYPRRDTRFLTKQPIESKWFIETLERTYKEALATQTKTTS